MVVKPILEGSTSVEVDEWRDMCDELTTVMNRINPSGLWRAEVTGFGWRSIDGEMERLDARTGEELLFKILPKTDCTFKVYRWGRFGLMIDNAHHDKPCGGEIYRVKRI